MPGSPLLRGDRVDLHTFEAADIGLIAPVFEDPRMRQRMGAHYPYTERAEREWYESLDEKTVGLTVCPHERSADGDPVAVGVAMLTDVDCDAGTAELGLTIAPAHQGAGYGTEAGRLLLDYAFDERRLHRVEAVALSVNAASQSLLSALGFTQEGRSREAALFEGERVDEVRFGLLAPEWRERREAVEN